jgi:beta-phosphoglucomutase-like phosphatase (HAD superfamily)
MIPTPPQPCLLFDIDGTLADTDHHHFVALQRIFAPRGLDLDMETFRTRIIGRANAQLFEEFFPQLAPEEQLALSDQKEALFRKIAGEAGMTPVTGLFALLAWAQDQALPMGVVTNAPRLNADATLSGLGLGPEFLTLVIGAELAHGKPHPLPYLNGLRDLSGDAARSVAFEDSVPGVMAAAAAGMAVVGLLTSQAAETLTVAGAHLTVANFDDTRLRPFILERTGR